MQATDRIPELADAADVLSDRLRVHLKRLATLLLPHVDSLDRRFTTRLRKRNLDARQRSALTAITFGAAAGILSRGRRLQDFIEQVEYNGRRLAKLNLPPSAIIEALADYDQLLTPTLRKLIPDEYANFDWVREQLQFCVILTLNNAFYQVREAETQTFYKLFRVELESQNLSELMGRSLQALMEWCHADAGQIHLFDDRSAKWLSTAEDWKPGGSGLQGLQTIGISKKCSPLRFLSRPRQLGAGGKFQSCWSIPLSAAGRVAGVMQFGFSSVYEWLPREQELLAAAAERCLLAAEKSRLMEDLAARERQVRELAEHMLHVEEVERKRISRELHDEAGQSLLCIRLQMELIERSLTGEHEEIRSKLREARDLTEVTIVEMRRLIAALSPAVLELGLGAALRQLLNRFRELHPCDLRLNLFKLDHLPHKTEIIVYRLVQECCNNIAKHSSAARINISVSCADSSLRLEVEDDGIGFDVECALGKRDSFGLSGMRERVALLGGKFQLSSCQKVSLRKGAGLRKTRGTTILVDLPFVISGDEVRKSGKIG